MGSFVDERLVCDGGGVGVNPAYTSQSSAEFVNYHKLAASPTHNKGTTPFNGKQQQQQQQQQQQASYMNLVEHQNQQLQQLQQFINQQKTNSSAGDTDMLIGQNSSYTNGSNSNYFYYESAKKGGAVKRELGLVEKLVGSYGFVKCLDREGRLFFHYSSFQAEQASHSELSFKVNDLIEFEEGVDKRNGKPIAINITRFQQSSQEFVAKSQPPPQQQVNIDPINLLNLKELLKINGQNLKPENTNNGNYYNCNNSANSGGQPNYQTIMNGLKLLNIQNLKNNETAASNATTPTSTSNVILFVD